MHSTRPNPRVGCVLLKDERVVGEGFHERAGDPHAEIHALREAGGEARGATAYVTLEPCAHHGRTPPCTDALIAAGVARVVVAIADSDPRVAGKGLAQLRAAGIEIVTGVESEAARWLNIGFFSRMERARPWLRSKLALSADGRSALGNGQSKWLTQPQARADGHRFRARACALLTGIGTVLKDDPQLNVRLPDAGEIAPQTVVIVDPALRTPTDAKILQTSQSVVLVHHDEAVAKSFAGHVQLWQAEKTSQERIDLGALLTRLARERQCNEVHLEAGAKLSGALLEQGLIDEILIYSAPMVLGRDAMPAFDLPSGDSLDRVRRGHWLEATPLGKDVRLRMALTSPYFSELQTATEE